MSDGPLPESTCGVDSSPEAIAEMVAKLNEYDGKAGLYVFGKAAALLAQVARERDEALGSLGYYSDEARQEAIDAFRDMRDRAAAAERQLAEARAALREIVHAFTGVAAQSGANASWNPAVVKARALLSGETTRVEDDQ